MYGLEFPPHPTPTPPPLFPSLYEISLAAGTDDMALVFKDVCVRFPHTKLIGCGFSLGACVLTRFLGEKKERRDKFICAVSCCQGYVPLT